MSWLVHDSQDSFYRNPFGAVACNTEVILRLKVLAEEAVDSVHLRVWKKGKEQNVEMAAVEGRIYEAVLTAPSDPGLMWYYFFVIREGNVYYYGNNPQRLGGLGLLQEQVPPSYQVTVYNGNFVVPPWFSETVMYQIFVDRFYNGLEDEKVHNPKKGSLIHGQWHDTPVYIREPQTNGILRWNFFGGNLWGVIKKLPYLKELGIGVIYLNPIFESPSNHKYDTGDYLKIDPMYGRNETFERLCKEAAKLGMRVILDGVFSHTGSDSVYFNKEGNYSEVGAYQSPESPYYKWFRFSHYPDAYEAWWGIGTMPNVEEMEPSYRNFIMYDENSVVRYWMKLGAAGWRLDVADELPDEFIRELRQVMKEQDHHSVLIGEVWEDASNKVSYGQNRAFVWGEELDSVMNYPFRKILLEFLLGENDALLTHRKLMNLYENYPAPCFYACMNLLGSHDVPRILTLLGEGVPQDALNEAEQEKMRLSQEQRELGIARLKLAVLWQMTFPGVPCVYYGDEAGMEGYADPFNRGPYPWAREEVELLSWYGRTIMLRNSSEAFKKGIWRLLYADGDVYGFIRRYGKETVAVVINRNAVSAHVITLKLGLWGKGLWQELLTERPKGPLQIQEEAEEFVLSPLEGRVFLHQEEQVGDEKG